jgi:predicted RNA-binding protein with PIN domain
MADPTLYLFDGHNLLHAGPFADLRELRDTLASWVATRGARGVVVFDGSGADETRGPLEVRFAEHADSLIERLASENRNGERVCVVSSDATLRATAGRMVKSVTSQNFLTDFEAATHVEEKRAELADRLDAETRARLERRPPRRLTRTYVPIKRGPSQGPCTSVDRLLCSAST